MVEDTHDGTITVYDVNKYVKYGVQCISYRTIDTKQFIETWIWKLTSDGECKRNFSDPPCKDDTPRLIMVSLTALF